jgi:NAD(P)-dependent dehydrogenase (short-subunit alcohol dehydrogenase family)
LALAREGAAVVVNDFGGDTDGTGGDAGPAHRVADEIVAAGGKAISQSGDVAHFETGEELTRLALKHFGRLDILVNNAGIVRNNLMHDMTNQEWDAVIAVHLTGTFSCTRAASRIFRDQNAGVVVNTGSESGLGNIMQANYSAAKEGIVGLTRTAARELGPLGCRVNVIRPRAVTRITGLVPETIAKMSATDIARLEKQIPDQVREAGARNIGRWVPDQVAPLVVWLCTDAASNVNGCDFVVCAHEISLMTMPTIERTACTPGEWTLDLLDELAPRLLTGRLRNSSEPVV